MMKPYNKLELKYFPKKKRKAEVRETEEAE